MHEYSIVESLLELATDEAKKAGATKVKTITVKVGKLSGIEVDLLESAYEIFSEEGFCKDAKLKLVHQAVVIECKDCLATSTLDELDFRCPKCRGENYTIVDGEELILLSLEME